MPFKIPAIVRPIDLAEYDEAFKDQEGSMIWVWVNPPGSVKSEFQEARNELLALKGYEGDDFMEKAEAANRKIFAWYSQIWSQKEGFEWSPDDVRALELQCIDQDIGLWKFISGKTFDLIVEHQRVERKN